MRRPSRRKVFLTPPVLLLLFLLAAASLLAPAHGFHPASLRPPPCRAKVSALAPHAGGGARSAAGDTGSGGSGVPASSWAAAVVARLPPPIPAAKPMHALPMIYLPSALGLGSTSSSSSSSAASSIARKLRQRRQEQEGAPVFPREIAELSGHELLVLRQALRATGRMVAEACSVTLTGCGSVALAGDEVQVDVRESISPAGRRGWVTAPLVWEGRNLGAITVKVRGLRGEEASVPGLLGPKESLLLQASARRLARAVEAHPALKKAEKDRERQARGNYKKALARGGAAAGLTGPGTLGRHRRMMRRRSGSSAGGGSRAAAMGPLAASGFDYGGGARASALSSSLAPSLSPGYSYLGALLALVFRSQEAHRFLRTRVEPALQRLRMDALIWKLAFPAMAALALEPAMHLVDTVYLSRRLGPAGLAAFALCERAVALASLLFAAALSTPITPFVAGLRAQGSARVAYTLVVRRLGPLCLAIGLALVPLLNQVGVPLLTLLGVGPEALGPALEYYRIRVAGVPAILLNALAVGVYRGFMDTATPLVVALLGFALGYYLQPHWLPWPLNSLVAPDNALAGFGLTAVIAQYAATLLFILRLPAIRPARPPGYRRRRVMLKPMLTLLGQGLSLAARSVLFRILLLALSSAEVARRGGPLDVAAHQVALQLFGLPSSVLFDALAVAGQALVADCLGRHAYQRAGKVGRVLLSYGLTLGGALSLRYLLSGVPAFITQDAAVLAKARPLTLILGLLMPLTAYVQVSAGLLQGAQDYAYQIKLMVATVLSAIPVLKLLGHHYGLVGVWLSLIFVQGVRAVGLSHRLWRDEASPLTLRREGHEVGEKGFIDLDRLLPSLEALPGKARRAWAGLRQQALLLVDGEERERRRRERETTLAQAAEPSSFEHEHEQQQQQQQPAASRRRA